MKPTLKNALSVSAALVGLFVVPASHAALGEVTVSGSTWTGKVDGSTKYTGTSRAAAEVACMNAMSSGTIVIKNSGNNNGQMRTKTNVIVDGAGTTTSGGGTLGALYAANASNIGGWNFVFNSTDWYGHFWRTCNGQNMNGSRGTANKTYRIDNCSGGTGYNLYVGSPSDAGASGSRGSDNLETYGIGGTNTAGSITCNDRTDGCGTLLNYSSGFSFTSNTATRADWGGGYAGFRTANTNGKTTIGTVTSTSCGRGYFSVSGSGDCTVSTLQTYTTSSHGVWLQTTYNTRVNGGTVRAGNPCSTITAGSGNYVSVACQ